MSTRQVITSEGSSAPVEYAPREELRAQGWRMLDSPSAGEAGTAAMLEKCGVPVRYVTDSPTFRTGDHPIVVWCPDWAWCVWDTYRLALARWHIRRVPLEERGAIVVAHGLGGMLAVKALCDPRMDDAIQANPTAKRWHGQALSGGVSTSGATGSASLLIATSKGER